MKSMFFNLMQHWTKGGLNQLLSGAGVGLVVFAGLSLMVEQALDTAVGYMSGLSGDISDIFLLCGADTGLSIIGSAVLTRLALQQAAMSFGLIPKGGS